MDLDTARAFYDHDEEEPLECYLDGCGGTYVEYEGDKMCTECGHAPSADETNSDDGTTLLAERRWVTFWNTRSKQSGFYGHDRVRFVGAIPQSRHDYE